jgi:predicted Zn-dependent protease
MAGRLDATADILIDPVTSAVQRMSLSEGAVLSRAALLRQRGKFGSALEELDRLIAMVAPNAVLHNNRALELDPTNADVLVTRSALMLRGGEADAALEDLDRGLTHDPSHVHARVMRAEHHLRAGRTHEALADLDGALASDPRHLAALVSRARLLIELGKAEAARSDVKLALELSPYDTEVRALADQLRRAPEF